MQEEARQDPVTYLLVKGLALAQHENIPAGFMAHAASGLQVQYTPAMKAWLPLAK